MYTKNAVGACYKADSFVDVDERCATANEFVPLFVGLFNDISIYICNLKTCARSIRPENGNVGSCSFATRHGRGVSRCTPTHTHPTQLAENAPLPFSQTGNLSCGPPESAKTDRTHMAVFAARKPMRRLGGWSGACKDVC